MEIFQLFLLLLLISTLSVTSTTTDPYTEALLSFKSQILNPTNTLQDWVLDQNPDVKIQACSWSGVQCDKNSSKVVSLDLSMKNLGGFLPGKLFTVLTDLLDFNISFNTFSGQFPVEIFNLYNLKTLDINRNNFSGQFPNGVSKLENLLVFNGFSNSFDGQLPVEMSMLEDLKVLNLAGSYFNGPIPSEYGLFKSLEFIHLAGNFLSGQIPPELGNLKTVRHMEIGYNSYEGNIPWQFGNMSELQYLDIAGANLSGSIPKQLSNLTKLESLFLFKNELTGEIPWEFSRLKNLSSLDLSDNLLSGPIPDSFVELKNLKLLSLMYNEMSGTVPEGIAELPLLDTLFIWNNGFSGSLPQDLGRNSKLQWLDVSSNYLNGTIPPDICSGRQLSKLMLFSNSFTGSLAPSLSNCSSLVRLRLEENSFSGEIPLNFSNLPDLSYADLSRNNFTGGVPSDISKASKLEYFNVSNNPNLQGSIPAQIWSLPFLQNFSSSNCDLSGNIPLFDSCESISVIELHTNNLSGNIPNSFSKCRKLERLDLGSNKLTGSIPEEFAGLPVLKFLDMSYNNLSGSIPKNFGDAASSLLLFNVSFNDISGSIPLSNTLRKMGSSAYIGNSKLCGEPLGPCESSVGILGSKGKGKSIFVSILCSCIVVVLISSVLALLYVRKGNQGQWKMVSFIGLPQFAANDVLRSLSTTDLVCKAVLPTGITVSVKKVEWEGKKIRVVSDLVSRIGNARHKNLIRLLGFCYNNQMAYLLYDYSPNGNLTEKIKMKRDWSAKYRIVMGIARGLCFLHHDCYPAIPHGDLKLSNVLFDDNMEPHLAEFGIKYLPRLAKSSFPAKILGRDTGEFNSNVEIYIDIYNFGEIILEVLTNGRLTHVGSKPREVLLREIYSDNEVGSNNNSLQEEIKTVVDVALLCTKRNPSERPSMDEILKLLSALKPQRK
ncbi:hypothetical protein ACFE04_001978 [Oxalis oulophora]